MRFRVSSLCFITVLMLMMLVPTSKAAIPNPPGPHEYVVATIGEPETVDPALAYDTASGELIMQVYETMVEFKAGSMSEYVPELATNWTISPDGQTYTFTIREGVPWQDPAYGNLTAADVEYSFERVLVRDFAGGPGWMFYESIFGTYRADMTDPVLMGQRIDAAIESNSSANTITIQFATGHSYAPFLSILTQTWASVLSMNWATAQGDWPGTGLQDGTWATYHRPSTSPLDGPPEVMMGTGSYKLDYWTHGVEWSIVKFDGYWGGWGNPRRGFAARGYLTRVTVKEIYEWATRLTGFLAGIYDSIYVPRQYMSQAWQQPGVRCVYPLTSISVDAMFFNYEVNLFSSFIGDGINPGFTFGETGIRPDFFSDAHARKAVAYSFNWTQYISTVYMGEAKQNAIPVPDSFEFFDGSLPKYGINIPRALEEWQAAWDGQVWTNGFYFMIAYNEGNLARQKAAEILKANVESQNPKFHIALYAIHWDPFWPPVTPDLLPIFQFGWLADYPDVHNFAEPFIASWASLQRIDKDPYSPEMDNLIRWGLYNTTDAGRKANYDRLWQLYIQQAPSIPLVQTLNRRWERDWVHGWYYNPILPGSNYYSMWKEDIYASTGAFAGRYANWEDINEDGKVDIKDVSRAAKAFGAYFIQPLLPPSVPPPIPPPSGPWYSPNWDSRADVNVVNAATGGRGDMKIDIKDLATIVKLYGFIADSWQPPP